MRVVTVRGHTFLADGLKSGAVVVDLGANRGEFSEELIRRFGVSCFAVEPSPSLATSIRKSPGLKVFNVAIAERDAPIGFHVSQNDEMSSVHAANVPDRSYVGQIEVPGRTLSGLLRQEGIEEINLLKVDIEGAEAELFGPSLPAETLAKVDQVSVEFHDFTGAVSAAEIGRILRRFRQLGFYAIRFSHSNMDWLLFRPERLGVGFLGRLWLKYAVRNWRFLKRNLQRAVSAFT